MEGGNIDFAFKLSLQDGSQLLILREWLYDIFASWHKVLH